MPVLRICLLGSMELSYDGHVLPAFPTRKSRDIFSYLIFHRDRKFQRQTLASTFWQERSEISARKCLSTELWRIRSVLKPKKVDENTYLTINRDSVRFNLQSKVWLDVAEFESMLGNLKSKPGSKLSPNDSQQLKKAVDLYRGELLEGDYNEWCLYARERLKTLYLSALEQLSNFHQAQQEWAQAATYAKQSLLHDPLQEHIHRKLMHCYFAMGERAMALRQFGTCAKLLREELNVEPMDDTLKLYQQIRSNVVLERTMPQWKPGSLREASAGIDQIASDLYLAQRCMEEAMRRLQLVIEQWNRVSR